VNNGPDADNVIRETTEQGLTICRPSQRNALRLTGVLSNLNKVRLKLIDNRLALEIEDLDATGGGSAEPVAVGAEDQGVDNIAGFQGVQVLAVVEVPKHSDAILTTGGGEGTIRGDGNGVDIAGVAVVVGAELALAKLPDLDNLVPTARDNHGVQGVRAETNARYPLGVTIILNVEFAFAKGVPQLNGAVPAAADNLPVISTEADTEDIGRVTNKATGGLAGVQVPETKSVVPRGGERELAIRRDDNVRYEVVVTVQNTLGVTILVLLTT